MTGRQWMRLSGGPVRSPRCRKGSAADIPMSTAPATAATWATILKNNDRPAGLALTRQGHRVRAVESGEQGLDRLRTDLPDVVVLDLADEMVVMRDGQVVEQGRAEEVLLRPTNPRTASFLSRFHSTIGERKA